jgi:hypothetical protein
MRVSHVILRVTERTHRGGQQPGEVDQARGVRDHHLPQPPPSRPAFAAPGRDQARVPVVLGDFRRLRAVAFITWRCRASQRCHQEIELTARPLVAGAAGMTADGQPLVIG